MSRITLLLALVATACTGVDQPRVPVELGDAAAYATQVSPYVGLGCGSLDCHGDPGRQLRVHGLYGLRLDVALRDQPTSAAEIDANVRSFAAVGAALTLGKGLAVDAGGLAHEGGDVWLTTDAPGYQCLLTWLEGRASDGQDACSDAFAELDVD